MCVCVSSLSLSVLIKGSKYERWVECKCIVVNVLQLWMQMYCNWIRKKVCYYAIDNCFCISFLLNKLMFLIGFFLNKLVYKCPLMNVIWFLRTYLVIRQRTAFKRTIFYLFQVGRLYVHVRPFKTYNKIMKFLQTESTIGESIFPEYVSKLQLGFSAAVWNIS